MKSLVFSAAAAAALFLSGCQSMAPALPPPVAGATVNRLTVVVDPQDNVPTGTATLPLGVGSGLDFVGVDKGDLVFWGITDRGPNFDGPAVGSLTSKLFPAPLFHPSLAEIRVSGDTARVTKVIPLNVAGKAITGLPLPSGTVGFSQEAALSSDLKDLGSDVNGLDTETVRRDPKNPAHAWISDEYGPFIAEVDFATGAILRKFGPGNGLPDLLAKRQPNRGMEGLAVTPSGKVVGAMQSILDLDGKVKSSQALFTRLVVLDPSTGKTAQYGYPIDTGRYKKAADAKIGDLVALSETEFLILEQGNDKKGSPFNLVYKLSIKTATDLTAQTVGGKEAEFATAEQLKSAGLALATKTLVMDLRNAWAWKADKAEGLAVLDQRRFAVISDNDFGVTTVVDHPASASDGKPVTDPTAYSLADGVLNFDNLPTTAALVSGDNGQPTAFWIFTTEAPLY